MRLIQFRKDLEYQMIEDTIRSHDSVVSAHTGVIDTLRNWWESDGIKRIEQLRDSGSNFYAVIDDMKSDFVRAISDNGILDNFEIRGAFVGWLNHNESTLRTIFETGYPSGLVDDDSVLSLDHKHLLNQRNELEAQCSEINIQYELLTRINKVNSSASDESEDNTDENSEVVTEGIGNFLTNMGLEPLVAERKLINDQIKALVSRCKEIHNRIFDHKTINSIAKSSRPSKTSTLPTQSNLRKIDALIQAIKGLNPLKGFYDELVQSTEDWDTLTARLKAINFLIKPHEDYKTKRNNVNEELAVLKNRLYTISNVVRKSLSEEFVKNNVNLFLCNSLVMQLQDRLNSNADDLVAIVRSMYERYSETLDIIRTRCAEDNSAFDELLVNLGYREV